MPGKQIKTRRKTCDISAADTGSLYINSDIIKAITDEINKNPNLSVKDISTNIKADIVNKFKGVNHKLVLIEDKSIENKTI